jgi:hypothetical protein
VVDLAHKRQNHTWPAEMTRFTVLEGTIVENQEPRTK